MVTKQAVRKAIMEVGQVDSWDGQVTKSQCRRLNRLVRSINVSSFSLEQLKASLEKEGFMADFITDIVDILSR